MGSAVPLGLIVEARLNGAGAGKVSAQRGRQRRKYHSCTEGRYLTPHSTLRSEKREEEEPPRQKKKIREQHRIEAGDVTGGEGWNRRTTEVRSAESSEETA